MFGGPPLSNFQEFIFYHPGPRPGSLIPKGVLCLCFEPASPLWEALRTAANEEDVVVDICTADGVHRTSLFCTFVASNEEFQDNLKDHYCTWSKWMKSALLTYPDSWNEVLRDFPFSRVVAGKETHCVDLQAQGKRKGLPLATSREALGVGMPIDDSLVREFLRYFAYYNWEYRLCAPNFHKSIDRWHKSEDISETGGVYNKFKGDDWCMCIRGEESAFGDAKEVDWGRWKGSKNSMLLPRFGKPKQELLFVREPTCVNFPAFVHLLGKEYSGAEILKAWELMPVIKRKRPNGGRR